MFQRSIAVGSAAVSTMLTLASLTHYLGKMPGVADPQSSSHGKDKESAVLLHLDSCLGKDFTEYESSLGTAKKVEKADEKTGEERTYSGSDVSKSGIKEIQLSNLRPIPEHTEAVSYIRCAFTKDSNITWQRALQSVGLRSKGVTAWSGTSGTVKLTLFEGLSIKDIPLAKIETGEHPRLFGPGWAIYLSTRAQENDGVPVLYIKYFTAGLRTGKT